MECRYPDLLYNLLEEKVGTDLQLVCRDGSFSCHAVMLAVSDLWWTSLLDLSEQSEQCLGIFWFIISLKLKYIFIFNKGVQWKVIGLQWYLSRVKLELDDFSVLVPDLDRMKVEKALELVYTGAVDGTNLEQVLPTLATLFPTLRVKVIVYTQICWQCN